MCASATVRTGKSQNLSFGGRFFYHTGRYGKRGWKILSDDESASESERKMSAGKLDHRRIEIWKASSGTETSRVAGIFKKGTEDLRRDSPKTGKRRF